MPPKKSVEAIGQGEYPPSRRAEPSMGWSSERSPRSGNRGAVFLMTYADLEAMFDESVMRPDSMAQGVVRRSMRAFKTLRGKAIFGRHPADITIGTPAPECTVASQLPVIHVRAVTDPCEEPSSPEDSLCSLCAGSRASRFSRSSLRRLPAVICESSSARKVSQCT